MGTRPGGGSLGFSRWTPWMKPTIDKAAPARATTVTRTASVTFTTSPGGFTLMVDGILVVSEVPVWVWQELTRLRWNALPTPRLGACLYDDEVLATYLRHAMFIICNTSNQCQWRYIEFQEISSTTQAWSINICRTRGNPYPPSAKHIAMLWQVFIVIEERCCEMGKESDWKELLVLVKACHCILL